MMSEPKSKIRVSAFEIVYAVGVCGLTVFAFLELGPLEGICAGILGIGSAYVLLAVWNPPPRKPPLPDPAKQRDPVAWAIEHDEHRYDPGYWTGGRIHPVLRAGRPNRYGFYLIIGSFLTLGIGAFAASTSGGSGLAIFLLCAGISAVQLAAGWALVRHRSK